VSNGGGSGGSSGGNSSNLNDGGIAGIVIALWIVGLACGGGGVYVYMLVMNEESSGTNTGYMRRHGDYDEEV
jgi:hypothetical protein